MIWKLAAIAWTALIIIVCSIPGTDLPATEVAGLDKVGHFVLFAVFGWLWLTAVKSRPGRAVRNVLLAGLVLALLTEIYQGLLPFERDPSALDAAANAAGLFAGIAVRRVSKKRPLQHTPL